ncbi:MAG: hypothetical protein EPN97_06895 [Alphaproteobacteria bacterium]|nr:MAG: hypothetical protein EPN97_06895 [Alphaproteobacteria bacterium]
MTTVHPPCYDHGMKKWILLTACLLSIVAARPAYAHGGEGFFLLICLAAVTYPVFGTLYILFWAMRLNPVTQYRMPERKTALACWFLGLVAAGLATMALDRRGGDFIAASIEALPLVLLFPTAFAAAGHRYAQIERKGAKPRFRDFLYVPAALVVLSLLAVAWEYTWEWR